MITDHLSLFDRAREAVQQEALAAGWCVQVLLNELHHHLIADLQTRTESVGGFLRLTSVCVKRFSHIQELV